MKWRCAPRHSVTSVEDRLVPSHHVGGQGHTWTDIFATYVPDSGRSTGFCAASLTCEQVSQRGRSRFDACISASVIFHQWIWHRLWHMYRRHLLELLSGISVACADPAVCWTRAGKWTDFAHRQRCNMLMPVLYNWYRVAADMILHRLSLCTASIHKYMEFFIQSLFSKLPPPLRPLQG